MMKSEKTKSIAGAWEARDNLTFDQVCLAALKSGEKRTTRRFERHFRPLLRLKLWARVKGNRQESLIDEVIAATLEGIRRDELRDPQCLPRYVCAVCTGFMEREPPFASSRRSRKSSSYNPGTAAHVLSDII